MVERITKPTQPSVRQGRQVLMSGEDRGVDQIFAFGWLDRQPDGKFSTTIATFTTGTSTVLRSQGPTRTCARNVFDVRTGLDGVLLSADVTVGRCKDVDFQPLDGLTWLIQSSMWVALPKARYGSRFGAAPR